MSNARPQLAFLGETMFPTPLPAHASTEVAA
jgi:hypothetical protein